MPADRPDTNMCHSTLPACLAHPTCLTHPSCLPRAPYLPHSPFMPRGLSSFISARKSPLKKYSVSSRVLMRHCKAEFMKQVLPIFFKPRRRVPATPCFFAVDNKSRYPPDATVAEIRERLDEVTKQDPRQIKGLNGKLTSYLDFVHETFGEQGPYRSIN